jgi:hypothetical protein
MCLHIMKPLGGVFYQGLSNDTICVIRGVVVWEIFMWQTNKINKQPQYIDNTNVAYTMGPSDDKAQLWKNHLKFKINLYWQKIFKFIISPRLSLKIMKSSPRNLMHQMFSQNTKSTTPFSYIYNCSIFNNSCNISLNITKPPRCTCIYQGFSNITKSIMRALWFGRFQCDKQIKQINYLL